MRNMKRSVVGLRMLLIFTMVFVTLPATTDSQGQGNQPPLDVRVVNTPSVRDVDNPALRPVQAMLTHGPGTEPSQQYVVPAGKRLIIEFVSGVATTENITLLAPLVRTTAVTRTERHAFTVTRFVRGDKTYHTFTHPTRLYSDPGTTVALEAHILGESLPATIAVVATISGYLIDVPFTVER